MPNIKKRVVVALSGGVDSSVAAHLLVKKGYEVIGIFMKNWHDESVTISNECPWVEDSYDAMIVAEKLSIPFQTIDLSKDYQKKIVDYMFNEYKNGSTPNPDVLCNREIKFDVFLKIAMNLGADFIATGHYCRVKEINKNKNTVYQLLSGKDQNKDQSYFLCQLSQEQLSKTLFPIGEMDKSEVRSIAKKEGLITAEKKDSQGLCFIGKVKLPDFLQQKLKKKRGKIVQIPSDSSVYKNIHDFSNYSFENLLKISNSFNYDIEDGEVVGEHNGAHFFTNGQRKGLSIGGSKDPLYVIKTDVINNVIYVGEGKSHPGLFRKVLFIKKDDIHLVRSDLSFEKDLKIKFQARIRYRQQLQDVELYFKSKGVFLLFKNEQSAITKGQFAVWYERDELIGSGVIN
jgi:tRNA-specific 2-thiouridylase